MKPKKKYLIVVEGAVMEPSILKAALPLYGFRVFDGAKIRGDDQEFQQTSLEDGNDEFYVIQGPRSRIKDVVKLVDEDGVKKSYES